MNAGRIHELKNKFIRMFMIAIVLVMVVMGVLINITNYITTQRLIYNLLTYITENQGSLPAEGSEEQERNSVYNQFSSEYKYSTRYFTVTLDSDNKVSEVKVNHIANVNKKQAVQYVKKVQKRFFQWNYGRIDNYFYKISIHKDGSGMIAFVDGTTQIRFIERIVTFSVLICGICFAATWLILRKVSLRLVKPEIENMKRQKQFITNASHELKTPLAVIRANMEVEEMINGESEWTQSTVRQVDRMDGLIQNLVMIARAEESEDSTGMVDTDVSAVVEESVDPFTALAKQDKKELIRKIQPDIHMVTNGSILRQLTSLLVDNAIKYCDENGFVKVVLKEVKARKGGIRKKDMVCLKVSNSYQDGENVDYTRFFDRFYREDKSHNVDRGGYGIGLSVAESICRQYGGTIRADWKDGVISFICMLPKGNPEAEQAKDGKENS